jgi:hypothetical protein
LVGRKERGAILLPRPSVVIAIGNDEEVLINNGVNEAVGECQDFCVAEVVSEF